MFSSDQNSGRELTPEEALWGDVIRQAFDDLKRPAYRDNAMRWFQSKAQGVGSLSWTCVQLGLDPDFIRQRADEVVHQAGKRTGAPLSHGHRVNTAQEGNEMKKTKEVKQLNREEYDQLVLAQLGTTALALIYVLNTGLEGDAPTAKQKLTELVPRCQKELGPLIVVVGAVLDCIVEGNQPEEGQHFH